MKRVKIKVTATYSGNVEKAKEAFNMKLAKILKGDVKNG